MSQFYERLGNASIKAEALRQAQIALTKGEIAIVDGKIQSAANREDAIPLTHPYFWAAFTLIGNPW